MKQEYRDWHYRLAVYSVILSIFSLLLLALSVSTIYMKTTDEWELAQKKSLRFMETSNMIWSQMQRLSEMMHGKRPVLFSRAKRDPFGGFCKGCFPLACPMGPPGPPGSPGPDGRPGESGNQGFAGEDGFDVQLESEPEMPCVVCPAGPPGPRGSQGERGRQGQSGQKGDAGPDGNPGIDGPLGLGGLPGNIGPRGPDGPQGLEGKTAVAGIGIKGPKGPPGPMGMMGPPGPQGRNSNLPGETGKPGPAGPMGPQGGPGMEGNEGPYGPPGEPGMPASYCPSDCGVQQILANIMPEKMAVHKLGEGYQGYESAQSAPSNTNSGSYARLRDDPAFQAKLKRKMARKHRLRHLKIRRL